MQGQKGEEYWLSGMDLNHDKSLQRALCYHYTTGQTPTKYRPQCQAANKKLPDPRRPRGAQLSGFLESRCKGVKETWKWSNIRMWGMP